MSTSSSVPGMVFPQEKPMLAGNPKDSAIAANNQSIAKQSELIKATSGGSRRKKNNRKSKRNKKYKHGGATTSGVVVPQYQMQYTPTGASGQTPNDIIKQNASVSTQGAANAEYDNLAKKGGSKKRKGGNTKWGCYSGGRKKTKKHNYKSRKMKKKKN